MVLIIVSLNMRTIIEAKAFLPFRDYDDAHLCTFLDEEHHSS